MIVLALVTHRSLCVVLLVMLTNTFVVVCGHHLECDYDAKRRARARVLFAANRHGNHQL